MAAAGVTFLSIREDHVIVGADLTLDHADPFDRLLLATALVEEIHLAPRTEP